MALPVEQSNRCCNWRCTQRGSRLQKKVGGVCVAVSAVVVVDTVAVCVAASAVVMVDAVVVWKLLETSMGEGRTVFLGHSLGGVRSRRGETPESISPGISRDYLLEKGMVGQCPEEKLREGVGKVALARTLSPLVIHFTSKSVALNLVRWLGSKMA